jgi:short subunit dehydrogenase-like uncharacterized protein
VTDHQRSPSEEERERWRQLVAATSDRLATARRERDAAVEAGDVDGAMERQMTVLALEPVLSKLAEAAERSRGIITPAAAMYAAQIARNRR